MAILDSGSEARSPLNLIHSVKQYLGTWVEVLRTRLDLVATEIEEERERVRQLIVLAAITAFCLGLGVLLVTFFVVILFWESDYRLLVVGGFALLYLAAGVIVGMVARQKSRQRTRLFSATLGELAKDYNRLSS